jgi:large subunit ribosomal protein L17
MRHYKKGRKLGTDASHTKAIKKNLVANLFLYDRVKTTLERAKEIRGDVDRIITWAKRGDVHSRRLAIAYLGDKDLVHEIFAKVEQGLFAGRPGGYSRILRLGKRRGDAAVIVIMELVQEPVVKKAGAAEDKPAARSAAASKPARDAAEAEKDDAAESDAVESDAVESDAAESDAVAEEAGEAAESAGEPEAAEAVAEAEAEAAEVAEAEAEPEAQSEPAPEAAEAAAEAAEAEPVAEAEAAEAAEAEAVAEAEAEAEAEADAADEQ